MAQVLKTSEKNVLSLGASLGLPEKRRLSDDQLRRIYITVIRQNWHLLPEAQIIELLGWTKPKFDFTLKEDDFLDIKLGNTKPECQTLVYNPPTEADNLAASHIRAILNAELGAAINEKGEDAFGFLAEYARPAKRTVRAESRKPIWDPRIIYSFFALYGDPLLEPESDPFPDEYLAQLASAGINGVWMQAVLNNMAPAPAFPEFGKDCEKRLDRLNILIERAARHGIRLYLYLNEPRSMPAAFFDKRPEMLGSFHNGVYAMCTSAPAVRDWIRASMAHITRQAPGLGGFFTITMSENHTNCYSHTNSWREKTGRVKDCPRCSKREGWEVIADLHQAMQEGIRESGSSARILAYDWGWSHEMLDKLIPLLQRGRGVVHQRMGPARQPAAASNQSRRVFESVPGPRPARAEVVGECTRHGLAAMAKIQANNTWEISAVPYIPCLRSCLNTAGRSPAWAFPASSLRGLRRLPFANLEAASAYYHDANPDHAAILRSVAERRMARPPPPRLSPHGNSSAPPFRSFPTASVSTSSPCSMVRRICSACPPRASAQA